MNCGRLPNFLHRLGEVLIGHLPVVFIGDGNAVTHPGRHAAPMLLLAQADITEATHSIPRTLKSAAAVSTNGSMRPFSAAILRTGRSQINRRRHHASCLTADDFVLVLAFDNASHLP